MIYLGNVFRDLVLHEGVGVDTALEQMLVQHFPRQVELTQVQHLEWLQHGRELVSCCHQLLVAVQQSCQHHGASVSKRSDSDNHLITLIENSPSTVEERLIKK